MTESVEQFLHGRRGGDGLHVRRRTRPDLEGAVAKLGSIGRIVGATLRDTANPTMLKAGYKANVIPATAEAVIDCRVLPGRLEAFRAGGRRDHRARRHPRMDHRTAAV